VQKSSSKKSHCIPIAIGKLQKNVFKTISENSFFITPYMKINFTRLANKLSAFAKSFSRHQLPIANCQLTIDNSQLSITGCSNPLNKSMYKHDPLTAGSFSFLYNGLRPELVYPESYRREGHSEKLVAIAGGQSDFLLKKNNKSTHNSQFTIDHSQFNIQHNFNN
jgi:hypothetical protein